MVLEILKPEMPLTQLFLDILNKLLIYNFEAYVFRLFTKVTSLEHNSF